MKTLLTAFDALKRPKVLVVGDLMLDRYLFGEIDRLNPEAPVPVLRPGEEEVRLGGAASVAALLRGLEAEVTLAGVIGNDPASRIVTRLLAEANIDTSAVIHDPGRPTTEKTRILGRTEGKHSQQLLRIDRESLCFISSRLEARLLQSIRRACRSAEIILVSDYNKGVCTPRLLRQVQRMAALRNIPVLVDPGRHTPFDNYRGLTAVLPNRSEALAVVGRLIETPLDGLVTAEAIAQAYGFEAALVKLDQDGAALFVPGENIAETIPAKARQVFDVTGAGDMVLAMMGLARASGLPWSTSAKLANVAAGLEVERHGVQPISREEIRAELNNSRAPSSEKILSLNELTSLRAQYRDEGKSVVLTNGCFDLLHAGHVKHLEHAAKLGDVLIVAVNSDAAVRRLKGTHRPVIPQSDRATLLAALACVNHVVVFEEDTPHEVLRRLTPDILCKGGDYCGREQVVGHEVVESYGGQVTVTSKVDNVSTSQILRSLPALG
jgi:D-beta-D-heptose 7-phosphate kinase/D-beta-D-heptose 1-phosphate adenosyltransferase